MYGGDGSFYELSGAFHHGSCGDDDLRQLGRQQEHPSTFHPEPGEQFQEQRAQRQTQEPERCSVLPHRLS